MEKFFRNDVFYRSSPTLEKLSVNACGFMKKTDSSKDWINLTESRYVMVYVLRGSGVYIDKNQVEYRLEPGSFFQRFPGEIHTTRHEPDGKYCESFAAFGLDFFQLLCNSNLLDLSHPVGFCPLNLSIMERFEQMLSEMKSGDFHAALLSGHKIVFDLVQNQEHSADSSFIKSAGQLLEQSVFEDRPLDYAAQKMNLSYENFRKQFKLKSGVSPGAYRNLKRIEYACKLLKESELTLKEIADLLRYSDVHSFNKQFTEKNGMPPGVFRKRG